jgi:hypothetical protein
VLKKPCTASLVCSLACHNFPILLSTLEYSPLPAMLFRWGRLGAVYRWWFQCLSCILLRSRSWWCPWLMAQGWIWFTCYFWCTFVSYLWVRDVRLIWMLNSGARTWSATSSPRRGCRKDVAGTSELYTTSALTWSATCSRHRGLVNQQLNGGDVADSRA